MAKVYFKGSLPPVEVADTVGEAINYAKEHEKPNRPIKVGNVATTVGEVKAVVFPTPDESTKYYLEYTKKWREDREKFYALSVPHKIAKIEGFFKLIRNILHYDFPKFEDKVAVFLSENPYRLYPDVAMINGELPKDHLKGMGTMWDNRMVHNLGNIIATDIEEAAREVKKLV